MADALAPPAGDARRLAPTPPEPRSRRLVTKAIALAIVVAGTAADLVTKADMQQRLGMDPDYDGSRRVIEVVPGFLSFAGTWNPGITFGLASDGHTLLIKTFTVVACLGILAWLALARTTSRLFHVALAMILGGALGNLYDRFEWNKVRDFVLVYWKTPETWHWPAFNVADSLIVVGVILILGHELFGPKPKDEKA
jgi:signal peptidase II